MAHSDALIFLTNITWVFLLFLFVYFFFVLFVLPTFYKKFRLRVLIRNRYSLINLFSSMEYIRTLFLTSEFFTFIFSSRAVVWAQMSARTPALLSKEFISTSNSSEIEISEEFVEADDLLFTSAKKQSFFEDLDGIAVSIVKYLPSHINK